MGQLLAASVSISHCVWVYASLVHLREHNSPSAALLIELATVSNTWKLVRLECPVRELSAAPAIRQPGKQARTIDIQR